MNIDGLKKRVLPQLPDNLQHFEKLLSSRDDKGGMHFSVSRLEISLKLDSIYGNWINSKVNDLKKADITGISSIMGEIRALGYLHDVFVNNLCPKTGKGPDFEANLSNKKIVIEVNTQLGSQKNTIIDHGSRTTGNISIGVREIVPYSFPVREKDNITGNAVSKIAGIKCLEHQFQKDNINILWIDYLDPISWIFDMNEQDHPISVFNKTITSGPLWWAMYGKKGNSIFDDLQIGHGTDFPYKLEFDGKLSKDSFLDFVVFVNPFNTIVFQNHYRINTPDEIFLALFGLPFFKYNDSWINFPLSDLRFRVIRKRCEMSRLKMKIQRDKNKEGPCTL